MGEGGYLSLLGVRRLRAGGGGGVGGGGAADSEAPDGVSACRPGLKAGCRDNSKPP